MILSIHNLTAGYGKMTVLHQLTLEVRPGSFTVLLGPNGSGKSTLLKSVCGLATRMEGLVSLEGRDCTQAGPESLRGLGLAYMPQRGNVFPSLTVLENLLLAGLPARHAAALGDWTDLFPLPAAARVAGTLSGGERQMLALAMAWLARPRLMLLDEPTAGLAPARVDEVFALLQRLRDSGMTLLVVEQNARRVLRWCDRVCLLRQGRLVYDGAPGETGEILDDFLGLRRPAGEL